MPTTSAPSRNTSRAHGVEPDPHRLSGGDERGPDLYGAADGRRRRVVLVAAAHRRRQLARPPPDARLRSRARRRGDDGERRHRSGPSADRDLRRGLLQGPRPGSSRATTPRPARPCSAPRTIRKATPPPTTTSANGTAGRRPTCWPLSASTRRSSATTCLADAGAPGGDPPAGEHGGRRLRLRL